MAISIGCAAAIAAGCILALPDVAVGQPTPGQPGTGVGPPAESFLETLDLEGMLQNGPRNWVTLLAAIFFGLLAGWVCALVLGRIAKRFDRRDWTVRARVLADLTGPAKLALVSLGLGLGVAGLVGMSDPLKLFWAKTLLLLYTIALLWYAFNLVSALEVAMKRFTAKTQSSLDDQLVPLVRKALRIFLVVVGVMFIFDSVFERDITAWLAGLALAAVPLSFAAQDSVKDLIGAVIILFDRPFQIGERIVYAGYDGVIEEIGFRSTKVRTLTGHLVTIPNARIVRDPVENIGRRKSIRRSFTLGITYDTPREKIERAVQIIRDLLEDEQFREPIHPVIDGNEMPPRVYFRDMAADSLTIFIIYWYAPPAYWDYMDHTQRLNLRIFEEFEKAGIEFAFPTQTLYLAGDPKRGLAVNVPDREL